jgi:hypothetical protein
MANMFDFVVILFVWSRRASDDDSSEFRMRRLFLPGASSEGGGMSRP